MLGELFATLYKPPAFDPLQQYPLVDYIYPGPQVGNDTPAHWSVEPKNEYAMAALGLLVLTIDGRGSPGRGQSFHTLQYQKTQTAGFLEDHGPLRPGRPAAIPTRRRSGTTPRPQSSRRM